MKTTCRQGTKVNLPNAPKWGWSVLLLLFFCQFAWGGRWVQTGIRPAFVSTIAFHPGSPDVIYAVTDGSLLISRDGGRNWENRISPDSPVAGFESPYLLIDPVDPRWMYASHLLRSRDGGRNWERLAVGAEPYNAVHRVYFDPNNSATLYSVGGIGEIYKSSNRGTSWRAINSGLPSESVWALSINGDELVAGTNAGIYRSTNGGRNWAPSQAGMGLLVVTLLEQEPGNPRTLYAGTWNGLFRSEDGGQNWTRIGLVSFHIFKVAIDSSNPSVLYVSGASAGSTLVFKSVDRGRTYNHATRGLPGALADILIDPRDRNHLYGASVVGVVESRNGAAEWEISTLVNVQILSIDVQDNRRLYAVSPYSGFAYSTNAGRDWTISNNGLLGYFDQIMPIMAMAQSPLRPEVIFLGTGLGLYRSADRGLSWTRWAFDRFPVLNVTISPVDPNTIYAWVRYEGMVKSADGGRTWTTINSGFDAINYNAFFSLAIWINPARPQQVFMVSGDIWRSDTGGGNWVKKTGGLVDPWNYPVRTIVSISQLPDGSLVAAAGFYGVFRSTDWGESWKRFSNVEASWITYSPAQPSVLYALTSFVARSSDGGKSWISLGGKTIRKPISHFFATALALDPVLPDVAYMGSWDIGVLRRDASICFGDVTGDGEVDNWDWEPLHNHIRGLAPLKGEARIAADVNGDQTIDVADWYLIQLIARGLMEAPDCTSHPW